MTLQQALNCKTLKRFVLIFEKNLDGRVTRAVEHVIEGAFQTVAYNLFH